jgi:hypothetical protein
MLLLVYIEDLDRDLLNIPAVALYTFKPFRAVGPDRIIPSHLQKGIVHLLAPLCRIYRACRIDKFVHAAWRQVKVVCIPKPGKNNCTETKAFRLISLSSFLPRTLEKMIDR